MNHRGFIGSAGVIAPYQTQHMSASRVRPAGKVVSQARTKIHSATQSVSGRGSEAECE